MALKGITSGITRGYRFGVFLNVVLICVLATALAAGLVSYVRGFSYNHDLRFDFTRDHRYKLDPLAKNLLREAKTPIRVVFIYGFDRQIRDRARDPSGRPRFDILAAYYGPILSRVAERVGRVLHEWSKTSPMVARFEVFSQENRPARAQKIAGELSRKQGEILNKVVISMGSRRREIPLRRLVDVAWGHFDPENRRAPRLPYVRGSWRVQTELTSALRAVLSGQAAVVGVVSGLDASYDPQSSSFRGIRTLLAGQGYKLRTLKIAGMRRIPAGVNVLLLPVLGVLLDSHARRLLKDYERGGGRLLIVVDPSKPETYASLLDPYGVKVLDMQVFDRPNSLARQGALAEIRSTRLVNPKSVVAGPIGFQLPIHVGPSRALAVSPDRAPGAHVRPVLVGSKRARVVPEEFQSSSRKMVKIPGREHPLPNPVLALEGWRNVASGGKQARIVVLGGRKLLNPLALADANVANQDLFLNAMAWLADRPASIAMTPRDDLLVRIDPVQRAFDPIFWVGVAVLPGLALLLAAVSFFLRRN